MTYKDLKIIDSSWIDERIVDLQAALLGVTMTDETIRYSIIDAKIKLLEVIKLQLIDATHILTDCWDECQGICKCNTDMGEVMASREYLQQFLNTEVN